MVEECEDGDRLGFSVHAIEDHERCLADPRLVDAILLEILAGVGVIGKELEEEGVDASERTFSDGWPEMLKAVLQLTRNVPPRRVPRGRLSCPLEIEPRGQALEYLVTVDNFAAISLRDALIQLGALFGGHTRMERIVEEAAFLNMLDELATLGERELSNKFDNLGLRPGHLASLSQPVPLCIRQARDELRARDSPISKGLP